MYFVETQFMIAMFSICARNLTNDQLQSNFPNSCFLKDVKEAKGVAIKDMQRKVVMDLLHMELEDLPRLPTR